MRIVYGLDAKLYRNTGTYETPTWVEITNVRDLRLTVEANESDVTTRANKGWSAVVPTLLDGSIDFDMVYDSDDENVTTIEDAFFGRSAIEFAVMDGDIQTEGTRGLRASMVIVKFDRDEKLEDALKVSVTAKVTLSENPPERFVVENGS